MGFFSSFDEAIDDVEEYWETKWEAFCDKVATSGTLGKKFADHVLRKLTVTAPVILSFVLVCTLLHFIGGWSQSVQRMLAVHDTWKTSRLLQYTSLVTHIFVHSSFGHLRGNMTHLLLVGPSVEHAFGSQNISIIMMVVAIVSAFAHILVGNNYSHQLGASGVVFACILLNSLVGASHGKIPMAFVLVAILYLGEELALFFNVWNPDGISHHAHLTGGIVGAVAGFYFHRQQRTKIPAKAKTLADLRKSIPGLNKKKK
ncbi:hypothetical protein FisN_1Lh390 [Fistulifera solaris]|uniref:Peptidase S54 rhomboid domain-containing protein n=1 Tax=Fistulifera solaris TaxID=1519565 RepID=A0A1Z5K410_FISSO|nr:hypothetical protein FisN_1Lh390 [Fistulifera solaris]|eukprot:GAX20949.1 hypothetical protein FisN_1Lh390 [Fistulifera solaris]